MATPTTSYSSWLVRRDSFADRMPFIVKMGVPNGNGDIKNLLAANDIIRCLTLQKQLDKIPGALDMDLFRNTAGLILSNIAGYPAGAVDSGTIVCELPNSLLSTSPRGVPMRKI